MNLTEAPVQFESWGATLRGLLITPDRATGRLPGVILAHGTSATIQMVAIEYARAFARAGLAALIYDHRGFGRSSGEPCLEINPWVQCRGYVDALTFAATRAEIDGERIGLWGDSFTGGQVVVVSACDARAKVLVAQCPVFGPSRPTAEPSQEALEQIRETLREGDVTGTPETTTGPLPVVSFDQAGTPSLLQPIQAFRWFIEYGGRPGSGWHNRVTRVIPPTPIPYTVCPFLCAPHAQARKTLFMVAPDDEMVHANYGVARAAYDQMRGSKQWYDIADGHFGLLYQPSPRFDEAVGAQAQFLLDALGADH